METKRPRGRPPLPGGPKPKRDIRIGPVWDEAKVIAADRGETMVTIIEAALARYVRRHRT